MSATKVAPMRMMVQTAHGQHYILVIHVGEAGIVSSSQRLICVLADEVELALTNDSNTTLQTEIAVLATQLRKLLSWYGPATFQLRAVLLLLLFS